MYTVILHFPADVRGGVYLGDVCVGRFPTPEEAERLGAQALAANPLATSVTRRTETTIVHLGQGETRWVRLT